MMVKKSRSSTTSSSDTTFILDVSSADNPGGFV